MLLLRYVFYTGRGQELKKTGYVNVSDSVCSRNTSSF